MSAGASARDRSGGPGTGRAVRGAALAGRRWGSGGPTRGPGRDGPAARPVAPGALASEAADGPRLVARMRAARTTSAGDGPGEGAEDGRDAGWVAVDWGTSRLRAWGMRGAAPVWRASSERGMGALAPSEFEGALRELIAPHGALEAPVIACGMVGARQGWVEAPYAAVPCPPLGAPVRAPGALDVRVLPGLSQASPPDVMRGEETQIAGLIAGEPRFDGVAVLPGTHSKWARISAGEVVAFRTAMTGELFALLSERSVLRHSVAAPEHDPVASSGAFDAALADALARPEALAAALFTLRADGLLNGTPPAALRARLSGLLIGAELAALRPYWLGQDVAVIADGPLAEAYGAALAAQGVGVRHLGAEALTLAGLASARAKEAA